MSNSSVASATTADTSMRSQISQGLILQSYCNSVLAQSPVDFSGTPNLATNQTQINNGLNTAKAHANNYLNNIQPAIILNVDSIINYFTLHNAVPTALPPGSTAKQWVALLKTLEDQAQQYEADAKGVADKLRLLNTALGTDTAAFSKAVSDLNAAVNGDNGVIKDINGQLGDIQGKIDGAIAGIALSGLAIIGGVFMIIVGGVADFVTAGTTTPLVVGGIAVVAAGIGGEVASALTLKSLNDAKADLLTRKANLTAEVKLATGASTAYGSLYNQAGSSMQAATTMANAWTSLQGDLGNLSKNLEKGITSADAVRTLFLTAANSTVKTVLTDSQNIKNQMAGVQSFTAPKGETVGNFAVSKTSTRKAA